VVRRKQIKKEKKEGHESPLPKPTPEIVRIASLSGTPVKAKTKAQKEGTMQERFRLKPGKERVIGSPSPKEKGKAQSGGRGGKPLGKTESDRPVLSCSKKGGGALKRGPLRERRKKESRRTIDVREA